MYRLLPPLLFFVTGLTLVTPNCNGDVVCPRYPMWVQNGLHYYGAVKCSTTPCTEIYVGSLLIFDRPIQNLGCRAVGKQCECRTGFAPVAVIELAQHQPELYNHLEDFHISGDRLTFIQDGNWIRYYRAFTFVVRRDGQTISRQVALPIPSDAITKLRNTNAFGDIMLVTEAKRYGQILIIDGQSFDLPGLQKYVNMTNQLVP